MLVHTYATYISCRLHSIPPLLFNGHRLTGEPRDFENLFSRVLRMLPMTVPSLHSPDVTPCSKYPEECISRMPFVVRLSDLLLAPEDHVGAMSAEVDESYTFNPSSHSDGPCSTLVCI